MRMMMMVMRMMMMMMMVMMMTFCHIINDIPIMYWRMIIHCHIHDGNIEQGVVVWVGWLMDHTWTGAVF